MMSQKTLKATLAFLILSLMTVTTVLASPITITTDKPSYAPGATVIISGAAQAAATVTVQVRNPIGTTIFTDVVTATAAGVYSTSFRLPPDASQGIYTAYASAPEGSTSTTFTVTAAPAVAAVKLAVTIETGAAYFPGETAVIYILTDGGDGKPTDTNVTASIILPDGTSQALTLTKVATGLYKATYTVGSATGTYLVKAEATLGTLAGSSIKGFIVSPTLIDIKNGIATIMTDVGLIKTDVATIKPLITKIEGDVVTVKTDVGTIKIDVAAIRPVVTTIQGDVATIKTDVGTIKGTVTTIQGDVATIKTDVGTLKTTIAGVKSTVDGMGTAIYAAVVLALVAAVAAVVSVIQISRKIAG